MTDASDDLRNVIVFALADGDYDDQERAFIQKLADRIHLTDEQLAELTAQAKEDGAKFALSRDPKKAQQMIGCLAAAAAADHMVSATERRLLSRIARHTGVDDAVVEELIDRALAAVAVDDAEIFRRTDDIYVNFNAWDAATRAAKLSEFAGYGTHAVEPLVRILESYRVPDGADNALALKQLIATTLGGLGDGRAVYYLVQQVTIGEQDDEITSPALRYAAAAALGKITGHDFTGDEAGIIATRNWWTSRAPDRAKYDQIVM